MLPGAALGPLRPALLMLSASRAAFSVASVLLRSARMPSISNLLTKVATGWKPCALNTSSCSSVTHALTRTLPSAFFVTPWSALAPSDSNSVIAALLGSLNCICAGSSSPANAGAGTSTMAAATATAPIQVLMRHSPSIE